jgi:Rrf2 family protein
MRHGNQVEWALHAVSMLAALGPGKRLSAVSMAELFEVPPKYLAKALQALSGAGLIGSTTGPRGGYALARAAAEIRLLDVVDAIEGRESRFRCENIRRNGPCRNLGSEHFKTACPLAAAMWRAEAAWRKELAGVTIADIHDKVAAGASPTALNVIQNWIARQ